MTLTDTIARIIDPEAFLMHEGHGPCHCSDSAVERAREKARKIMELPEVARRLPYEPEAGR